MVALPGAQPPGSSLSRLGPGERASLHAAHEDVLRAGRKKPEAAEPGRLVLGHADLDTGDVPRLDRKPARAAPSLTADELEDAPVDQRPKVKALEVPLRDPRSRRAP